MTQELDVDGLWDRVETTVLEWQAGAEDEHRVLTERSMQARDHLKGLLADLDSRKEHAATFAKDAMALLQMLRRSAAESDELRARIGELEQTLAERASDLEKANDDLLKAKKALAEWTDAMQASQQRVAELQQALSEQSQTASGDEQRLASLETQLAAEQAQREALEACASEREAEFAKSTEEGEALRQEIARLVDALSTAEQGTNSLGNDVQTLTRERDSLAAALETARGEIAHLSEARDAAQRAAEDAHEIRRLLDVEREKVEMLNERIDEETAHGTKAELAQQLARVLADSETLHKEIARLRAELRSVRPAESEDLSTGKSEVCFLEDGKPRRLGDCLVESGAITRDQLAVALEELSVSPSKRLEAILVDQGFVAEDTVAETLAQIGGVEFVRLDGNGVQSAASRLITGRLATLHNCIPIQIEEESLTLAMANPLDLVAIGDVERASRCRVDPVVATGSDIRAAIHRTYGA